MCGEQGSGTPTSGMPLFVFVRSLQIADCVHLRFSSKRGQVLSSCRITNPLVNNCIGERIVRRQGYSEIVVLHDNHTVAHVLGTMKLNVGSLNYRLV